MQKGINKINLTPNKVLNLGGESVLEGLKS